MKSSESVIPAKLSDLHWMVGKWSGAFGPQFVEEAWSKPSGGTMSTMVRLTNEATTLLIELILIRQVEASVELHLRQFTSELQLVLEQNMQLKSLGGRSVTFTASAGASIPQLCYRAVGPQGMEVDVTKADGTVLTAGLARA